MINNSIDENDNQLQQEIDVKVESYNDVKRISKFDEMIENDEIIKIKCEDKKFLKKRFGNYVLTESGLYYDKVDKNDDEQPIWLSTPITPEAYLRDAEGKNHSLLLRLYDGDKFHLWAMPRRLISKWQQLNETLLDLGQDTSTSPTNQRHIQNFLMSAKPELKLRCVDKAGWHSAQYVFPDGEVIGKGKDNESVYPINEICPKGVKLKGTLNEWQDNVVRLCVDNSRLIFSLGTAFASLCLDLVGEDSGGFNFKGRSSKGKTKCLKVAISVIGSLEYKRSWKATSNGLEGVCALHNDSLLPLDEFGQVDENEVGEIVYMISEGIGKQRSCRDGSPREPRTWRILVLSTGEVGLEDHMKSGRKQVKAGQLARVVDIPAEIENGFGCFEVIHGYSDGKSFADAIDEACAETFGIAARAFIKNLIMYGLENAKNELRYAMDDFVSDNTKNCDSQVKRVAQRFGIVYGALLLSKKLKILGDQISETMIENSVKKCYKDWLGDRGTGGDIETHSLVEQVKGILQENAEGKFICFNETSDPQIRQLVWGYKNGTTYYVFAKAFKEQLCSGIDSKQAAKILIAEGILKPGNDGKSSSLVRIPAHDKQPDRFYVIDLAQIEG